MSFSFHVPTFVRFGSGVRKEIAATLPEGTRRVAFLRGCSGLAAEPIRATLEEKGLSCVDVICAGEPSVPSVNAAVQNLQGEAIDAVVAIGGGSVMDTGKAVAFCLGHQVTLGSDFSDIPAALLAQPAPLPCVALPTTAGTGAEVTANAVLDIPERQAKVSLRGPAFYPAAALVDPDLLRSAPPSVVLSSGLDAIVQTIEAYTSAAATPFSDALTGPNIDKGLHALKCMMAGNAQDDAWESLAWVSLTSGVALANGGLGAAHGLASVLGGRYSAPHGVLCGRLLAPVLRMNTARVPADTALAEKLRISLQSIATAFPPVSETDPLSGLEAWQAEHALPRLQDIGLETQDVLSVAEAGRQASSSQKNPVALTREDFIEILQDAF